MKRKHFLVKKLYNFIIYKHYLRIFRFFYMILFNYNFYKYYTKLP